MSLQLSLQGDQDQNGVETTERNGMTPVSEAGEGSGLPKETKVEVLAQVRCEGVTTFSGSMLAI